MDISDIERTVLAATEFRADLSTAQIARITKLKDHVVYHALTKMQERGIIQRRAYVDSYLLGTPPFVVIAKIPSHREDERHNFFRFLKAHRAVSFVAETAGSYDCWFEVRAANIFAIENIFEEVSERFADILYGKEVLSMPQHFDFSRVLKSRPKRQVAPFMESHYTQRQATIDSVDTTILNSLARDWSRSHRAIADELNLPCSTLTYRINRMIDQRIILATRYWVNLSRIGYHRYVHLISWKSRTKRSSSMLLEFARTSPSVSILFLFIGRWDYLIETHHQRAEDVSGFLKELRAAFKYEIFECETLPVVNFFKTSDCTTTTCT